VNLIKLVRYRHQPFFYFRRSPVVSPRQLHLHSFPLPWYSGGGLGWGLSPSYGGTCNCDGLDEQWIKGKNKAKINGNRRLRLLRARVSFKDPMKSASGQIRDANLFAIIVAWILGCFCLCFGAFLISGSRHSPTEPPIWVGIGVTVISVFSLVLASYGTMVLAKYGRAVFDPAWIPMPTDGQMLGTIRLPRPITNLKPIQLRLAYAIGRRPLWEQRRTLDDYTTGVAVSEIPVHFNFPSDARARRGGTKWLLYVKAKTKGVSFRAMFQFPAAFEIERPEIP